MTSRKKNTAFSAGTTDDHQTWINFSDFKLTYDDYLDIISKIFTKMTEAWPQLDYEQFCDDLMGAHSANLRFAAENNVYEMHMENLRTGKIKTFKFQLKNINKIVSHDEFYSFITAKETFKIGVPDYVEFSNENSMKREYRRLGIQYLLIDDQITFYSFSEIMDYAIEFGKFDNGYHKHNVINLKDFEKDQ